MIASSLSNDPGGFGVPLYRCGACPPGSLCHVFSQKNWARYFAIIARKAISPK
jgi:hypothetical protein